jgi:cyanophycinase-like exopeptidase
VAGIGDGAGPRAVFTGGGDVSDARQRTIKRSAKRRSAGRRAEYAATIRRASEAETAIGEPGTDADAERRMKPPSR